MIRKIFPLDLQIFYKISFMGLLALASSYIIFRLSIFAFDDAFIHFRIAENFASSGNPYYNLSDPILSTSSFIWTIFLAIICLVPFSIILKVTIINIFSIIFGALIWYQILEIISEHKIPIIIGSIFILSYFGIFLPSATGLMETPFAFLVLGVSIILILKEKKNGWLLLGVTIFLRLELIFLVLLFNLKFLKRNRNQNLLIFIIPIFVLSMILFYFFHTIIPNTAVAKNIVFDLDKIDVFTKAVFSLFPDQNYQFLQNHRLSFLKENWIIFFLVLVLFSFIGIPWKTFLKQKNRSLGVYFILSGLLILFVYIFNGVNIHAWYIPLFAFPIILGIYSMTFPRQPLTLLLAMVLSIIPISNLVSYSIATFNDVNNLPSITERARVLRYLEVGEVLAKHIPNKTLLTSEIGGLGFSYRARIFDAVGLISPSALKYHPMKVPEQKSSLYIGAIPTGFVKEVNPDIIVSYPIFVEEFDSSEYRNNYNKLIVSSVTKSLKHVLKQNRVWGSNHLFVYFKKDILIPNNLRYLLD